MKYAIVLRISLIIASCACIGWAAKEENLANCSGVLTPRDGVPIQVENVTINHKVEFHAYQKPINPSTPTSEVIILENEPTEFGPFHLNTIKTMVIPNPDNTWVYEKPIEQENKENEAKKTDKKSLRIKYIEIIIDNTHYLMPKNSTIQATDKNTKIGISIKKITGLKELKASGCGIAQQENTQK